MSKYGVISGPYFPIFTPNTGKYEQEIIPYFDTSHAVYCSMENLKKNWGRIRTNWEQHIPKIIKILRTASLGSNFTGSYIKKSVLQHNV